MVRSRAPGRSSDPPAVRPADGDATGTNADQGLTAREARLAGLVKTGEAARMLGTTARTLLFYEEEGLLRPRRTGRGTRMYSAFDLARAGIAIRLSHAGFPIKVIKQLAQARPTADTGRIASVDLVEILNGMAHDIDRKIAELRELSSEIACAGERIRQCCECPRRPDRTICPDCPAVSGEVASKLLYLILQPEP